MIETPLLEGEVVDTDTGEVEPETETDGSGQTTNGELLQVIELERFAERVREFCRESPLWRKFQGILRDKMDECEFRWLDPDSKPGDLKSAQLQLLAYRSVETILVDTVSREATEARDRYNEERRRHPLLHSKEARAAEEKSAEASEGATEETAPGPVEGQGKKRRGRKRKASAGAGDEAVEPRNESEKSEESEGGVLQMKQEGSNVTFFEVDPPREPTPKRRRKNAPPEHLGYTP